MEKDPDEKVLYSVMIKRRTASPLNESNSYIHPQETPDPESNGAEDDNIIRENTRVRSLLDEQFDEVIFFFLCVCVLYNLVHPFSGTFNMLPHVVYQKTVSYTQKLKIGHER